MSYRWTRLIAGALTACCLVGCGRTIHGRGQKWLVPPIVGMGQKIDLAEHVVPGKWTVFDFSSPYCGPCRQVAPLLTRLNDRRDDLAVVTVNINRTETQGIDWESPVARQFEIRSVPSFLVVSPEGRIHARGESARTMVDSWMREVER